VKAFEYQAPTSIRAAVALLAEKGERARPLAGGTDLLVQMRLGLCDVDMIVDMKHIPELRRLDYDAHAGLTIGAAVTCAELGEFAPLRAHYPGLWDGIGIIGGSAIQGRATVGGNLCNAAPSGDSIAALIVLGAMATIEGPMGMRDVPVAKFCVGPRRTVLQRGELLASVRVPPPQPHSGSCYVRFTPRAEMDIAVAGAGAWVRLNDWGTRIEEARIALSAVAPTPLVVEAAEAILADCKINAEEATDTVISEAAHLAREAARPIADVRGGVAQRQHLVEVLVKRALRGAIQRAGARLRAQGEPLHD